MMIDKVLIFLYIWDVHVIRNIDSSSFCFQLKLFFFSITPGGRYVLMVSLYNRLGGHNMRWSKLKGQTWGAATLPINHDGRYYNVEMKVSSVFHICNIKHLWCNIEGVMKIDIFNQGKSYLCTEEKYDFLNHHAVKCLLYRNNASHKFVSTEVIFLCLYMYKL